MLSCRPVVGIVLLVVWAGAGARAEDPAGGASAVDRSPAAATAALASRPGAGGEVVGATSAVIREPSQGRPIFIMPNETFYFVMRLPPGMQGDTSFTLAHAREPTVRVPLVPTTPPSYVDAYCMLVLRVPDGTAPGLYDLEVRAKDMRHYARRSVKVVDTFKTRFRFVHLSNMNIGDLTAPEFDATLPGEINVVAPEFIIATGDYTEWARARDDASSWQRVLKYFEKFDAPVFLLCGVHDHGESFSRLVASKPIGTIDYGAYHGLLLLDHAAHPIDQDFSQLQWVDSDLKRNRNKRFNFLAMHSDELSLLDIWRERGDLPKFIKEHKIKMFIVGGSTDWDFKEFADKLAGLEGFHLIRTHESSTCMRDRATGVSHFRVIEVDGDNVRYDYPDDTAVSKASHSIPTGRLRKFFDAPNDGTASRVGVTVQNALNQPFPDAHVWMRVAKREGRPPKVEPGRLVRALDVGSYWGCDVAVDLPDKGAVRIAATTEADGVPPPPAIAVDLVGPRAWTFAPLTTPFGLSYFHCDAKVSLKLTNTSERSIACWPVVRINASQLHPDRSVYPRLPLTLAAGETIEVPLVLKLRRVSPGRHLLQVYFLEDRLSRLHTFEIELAHEPSS